MLTSSIIPIPKAKHSLTMYVVFLCLFSILMMSFLNSNSFHLHGNIFHMKSKCYMTKSDLSMQKKSSSSSSSSDPLLLRATRGETVERVPVWMM